MLDVKHYMLYSKGDEEEKALLNLDNASTFLHVHIVSGVVVLGLSCLSNLAPPPDTHDRQDLRICKCRNDCDRRSGGFPPGIRGSPNFHLR